MEGAGIIVLAVSERVRAGDGSGTRILSGMGALLGVPMRGFHLDPDKFSVLGGSVSGSRNSGIAVNSAVSGGSIGVGSLMDVSQTSGKTGRSDESIEMSCLSPLVMSNKTVLVI